MSLMNSIAMPLLVINRDVSQARDRAIFFEQEDAAYQAVNYLISQGHSDIACITVPGHTPTGKSRLMGYRKALEKTVFLGSRQGQIRRLHDDTRL
jgi:DNA-binding LacI/PurR family transcriptional regulator